MFSNAIKLLFLTMAVMCVSARPEYEFPEAEVQADEMDNVEMDSLPTRKAESLDIKFAPKPLVPCPFDCSKVCVVQVSYTFGNPPMQNIAYVCNKAVHDCCKNACASYQKCIFFGQPDWVCYANTLDYLCKCRSLIKGEIIKDKGGQKQ